MLFPPLVVFVVYIIRLRVFGNQPQETKSCTTLKRFLKSVFVIIRKVFQNGTSAKKLHRQMYLDVCYNRVNVIKRLRKILGSVSQ